ncbi:ABC transporter permease [Aquihabitans sp. G128]|uniref:branched-chain amino acid ABC transporter permease n=1 Tax=Aquihabitans sp. G128 TaxID=2849779 RepID=UPI001C2113AC|nr:ABC transporter permease [Aquihabitans sp. G128]QXC62930.1 ABC transporter permease [Aquihabitans sp. G128]
MNDLLTLLVLGLVSASLYAVAASGLVVTYTTSGIFNFAHGAVAMFSAFVYWQLSSPDAWDLPVPVALALTLLVFAPGMGWAIDRVLMRRLHDATPITRIVVPIGLLVALIQLATIIWSPDKSRSLPRFFLGKSVDVAGVVVEYHQLVVFAAAIAVAIGLRILLYRTRIGVAMRAVVDSRDLAALNGASPDRVSALAWALGCSLAGLAGILIAPILTLDQTQLTLLVINAYAAAMVGRLRSLPLTALGALILGIAREAANQYSDSLPNWITVDTVPAIMLFIVLIVVPQDKAAVFGTRKDRSRVPTPSWRTVGIASVVLIAVAAYLPEITRAVAGANANLQAGGTLDAVGYGLALGIIALSLVPLTGYAGQISLAPLAFAGLGAVVMYEWGSDGNPLALIAVVVICGAVGALVALPALRLKGLYLGLATFAFALFCEKAIFTNVGQFSDSNASFKRLGIGSLRASSDRANLVLMAVVFVLLALMITALRRGTMGRRLQAMKDSPAACATLGLDLTTLKLQVFALSAAIAGLGGALLGGWRGKAGLEQFSLLQGALPGLPLVLLAVVGGIASVGGALLGGLLLAVFPLIGVAFPAINDLMTILPGLAGISLASNPDGAIAQTVTQVRARLDARRDGTEPKDTVFARAMATLLPPPPTLVPEQIPIGGAALGGDLAAIDAELGLDWGRCHADS